MLKFKLTRGGEAAHVGTLPLDKASSLPIARLRRARGETQTAPSRRQGGIAERGNPQNKNLWQIHLLNRRCEGAYKHDNDNDNHDDDNNN